MADNTGEANLDNLVNTPSEIPPHEIVSAKGTEYITPNQEIKNMEVHHHPKVEKKNFKEYFLEFIMIFLAVTLGFIAENIREDITAHQRAKKFAASMIEDLKADTAQIIKYSKYYTNAANSIDTFMYWVSGNDLKNISSGKLYWYGLWGGARSIFVPSDATFQQMKSSGSLSFFKPEIATNIEKYDRLCRSLQAIDELNHDIYTEVRKIRAQIFDFKYNEIANQITQKNRISFSQVSIDSFIATNPPLLSYDQTLMNQYVEMVRSRFIRTFDVAYSDSLLKQANIVLAELKNEFN
jgi:hypothetical protein